MTKHTDMNSNYNIAIVGGCLSSHGGGAPRSMASQANALAAQGIRTTFFAGYSERYPLTPEQLHISSEVVASPLWGPSVLGLMPRALHQLAKRASEFDYIHLNGAWNLTSYIAARIAVRHGVPYIISGRSHYGAYHYSRVRLIKPLLYRLIEAYKIRHAAAIHVTSEWEAATSKPLIGDAPVICIPNSIDMTDFVDRITREDARKRLNISTKSPLFVHLGRLGTQKNPEFLLDAFLEADCPDDTQLVFIGPSEGDTQKRLEAILANSSRKRNVRFISFAAGKERKLWLSAADLFVLPSWDENFCVAAIEAVACGTHCLISPHVGAIEFLPPSCVTVSSLDQQQWSELLTQHARMPKPQAFPPSSTFATFSLEHIGKLWENAYMALKGSKKGQPS